MFGTSRLRADRSRFAFRNVGNGYFFLLLSAAICVGQTGPSNTQPSWSGLKAGIPSVEPFARTADPGQEQVAGFCSPHCPIDWVGDGFCDKTCLVAECNYDGGDCGCASGCPWEWVGDDICDAACNNAQCNFDGGDCGGGYCAPGCPDEWIGDGICDSTCNNANCNHDGGDCVLRACCSPYVTSPECILVSSGFCLSEGGAPRTQQSCPADCPLCDAPCVWCWSGTNFEQNCNPAWNNDGECDCGCQFQDVDCPVASRVLISSNPAACVIDARIPHLANSPLSRRGFSSVVLTFNGPAGSTEDSGADYTIEQSSGPPPVPPTITNVTVNGSTATLTLSAPIQPNLWTCIRHNASNKRACLGYLPADVNSNRAAVPADILDLIDNLNGVRVPALLIHQCDIDRSTICAPADIIAEIDLLNGSNLFPIQNGKTLPACPYTLP